MRGGPKTIKNMAAREPAKSCEGARSEPRRPKRYKNRGFERSRKVSKKCCFAVLAGRSFPKTGKNGVFRFASGSLAALRFARFFGFWRSGRRAKIAKTLRFCGFRAWWRFWAAPFFAKKKGCPIKCEKNLDQKKNGAQLMFWSPIPDQFWRTVSEGGFSCGAERVFGPL